MGLLGIGFYFWLKGANPYACRNIVGGSWHRALCIPYDTPPGGDMVDMIRNPIYADSELPRYRRVSYLIGYPNPKPQ